MSVKISSNTDAGGLQVDSSGRAKVISDSYPSAGGGVRIFSENDNGTQTGTPDLASPETDNDYRLRVNSEMLLDQEIFNYAAQNTGKHTYLTTTMTTTWGTGGLTTNGSGITTTATGVTFGTWAEFPVLSTGSLYCEIEGSFSNQPVTNAVIDFGMFRRGASTAFAPTDGAYFRLSSAGMQGVINYNGVETTTSVFSGFTYSNNEKHRFILTITQRSVEFWIDDELHGTINTPTGNGQPFMSSTLPFSIRHAHPGTASGVIQANFNSYGVAIGGTQFMASLGEVGNRAYGSYQGLSGGTMGSLTAYTNSTNPTAAVPSNTALTANLPAGLGGQAWETATTAVNTDVILMSYQVPAGTISVTGRRLKIRGVKMTAFIQTVIAGGPWNNTFALAFGHTMATLAASETASTKKPRIVLLPELTQTVTAAQAVNTAVSQPFGGVAYFEEPIYVNPGEYVQFTMKRIGTVGTSGVVAYNIQYDYSWE